MIVMMMASTPSLTACSRVVLTTRRPSVSSTDRPGPGLPGRFVDRVVHLEEAEKRNTNVIDGLAKAHPATRTIFVRNPSRLGASESRNVGVRLATNDYILFCDDDEYLERGYAEVRTVRTARVQRTARDWGELWHCDGLFRSVRNAMLADRDPGDYRYIDWLYGS